MNTDVKVEFHEQFRPLQSLEKLGLDEVNLLNVLSQSEPFGVWRLELDTGLVYWSADVYEIHELEAKEGPVDVMNAVAAYHPDDRDLVINCIEEAVARKTGYSFVLRLQRKDGSIRLVKSNGQYRIGSSGREEIYGTFATCAEPVRGVSVRA